MQSPPLQNQVKDLIYFLGGVLANGKTNIQNLNHEYIENNKREFFCGPCHRLNPVKNFHW